MRGFLVLGAWVLTFLLSFLVYVFISVMLVREAGLHDIIQDGSALSNILVIVYGCGAIIVPSIAAFFVARQVEVATEPAEPTYLVQTYTSQIQHQTQDAMRQTSNEYLERIAELRDK
jgi:apolipoprotein N-acyltransferase